MDTSAAGEGSSVTFCVKQEAGHHSESAAAVPAEDESGRMIRKMTVLDPLKLKLLSRQNHNMLLSGLNAAKAKVKPPAPTPPPATPTIASTTTVTETEGEFRKLMVTEPEPSEEAAKSSTETASEPPPVTVDTKPPPPAAAKTGAGGGSSLFRRKKVVPVVIAKKIAQKEKAKPAPQPEAIKEEAPAITTPPTIDAQSAQVEEIASLESQPTRPVVVKSESTGEVIRPTAFRRIKPKVAICLNPSRPKKSILKKNSSSEMLPESSASRRSLKDLVPEETIVLEDDGDENETVEQQHAKQEEERRLRELKERRKQQEEKQRISTEEERRKKDEEERTAAEEKRRIDEEEKKKAEEQRRIEEEQQKKKAEEQQRIEEEAWKKAEERRRIKEDEYRKAEEQRRIWEEERQKAEEQRKIREEEYKNAEEQRRIEEDEKKKAEEQRIIEEEEKKKAKIGVEKSRKSIKIPPEVWKRQMEKMRTNPSRLHSAVASSESSNPPEDTKDSVTVEKSDVAKNVAVAQEPVSVGAPEVIPPEPEQIVTFAEQTTPNATREIRRISRLPPSVAMKLMNCVAVNPSKKKPQDAEPQPVKPEPKDPTPAPAVAAEAASAATAAVSQTKAIRRISRLPPNLALQLINSVAISVGKQQKQQAPQEKHVDKEEQKQSTVPEKAPAEVERKVAVESTQRSVIPEQPALAPAPTKEIKRIARLPPHIAMKLLSSVSKKKVITESPGTTKSELTKEVVEIPPKVDKPTAQPVEPAHEKAETVRAAPIEAVQVPQDPSPIEAKQEANPAKKIRRISQLPRNVAMKLMDSLKEKGILVPKLVLGKEIPAVSESNSTAASESHVPSDPTTPSSTASVSEIKIEPQDLSTKNRRKVEILSQVILPTASYNLEKLLAGKSAGDFNAGPSGGMPLPLPMPRAWNPVAPSPVESVPASIPDLPMDEDPIMKDDIASEVTVTTENDEFEESLHEKLDEYIIPEDNVSPENVQMQYEPPKINPQRQEAAFPNSQVPTYHRYAVSYASNSSQPIYHQTIQAPVAIQQRISASRTQPEITYYTNIPNTQPTSMSYRPQIAMISRTAKNPPRMLTQRTVLNPASVQQHPVQGQHPRFAATQFVLVRHPAPIRSRAVPQTQHQQLQHQSRQHLMVPKATYYHRYPIDGHNQHPVIVPTPRFMISTQSQIQPQTPPAQQLQRPHVSYVIPSISAHRKAFRPVESAQSSIVPPEAPPAQQSRIIPKIVIDSSYVEQQDRSQPAAPRIPPEQPSDAPKPLQIVSPCSEEIRNKLRDKVKARMLNQKTKSESSSSETPPSIASPPAAPAAPAPQPIASKRIPTIPPRNAVVYHPQDFQQTRMQLTRPSQPPSNPVDSRIIKQYICQGRKIYLTKISVTKPPRIDQSRPPESLPQLPWCHSDSGFHGFPQAVIKNDQRIFQQFSETVQQLERKISPEPPEGIEIHSVQRGRLKSRKPSVVTAVTTAGLEGDTFIITELIDPPEVAPEVQQMEMKEETPVKRPPRITVRRKTFVVDDSDVEVRTEQLPRVETTSQEDSQEEGKIPAVNVKLEDEEKKKPVEGRSAFERHLKEEEFSESDTSQADEDLAREILALVEKERKSLRVDSPVKKVKKRIKRRKRRKKKKDGNEEMMDLLMKHVNQESLIADIVARQQKQLPVVEISDTDDDDHDEVQRKPNIVHVKKDPDAEPVDVMRSSESDLDESETDIFAEILKPFVEEDKKEEEKVETTSAVTEEVQKKDIPMQQPMEVPKIVTNEPESPKISVEIATDPDPVIELNQPTTCDQICDTSSALPALLEEPPQKAVAPRAPKRKLKPTLVCRSKIRKLDPSPPTAEFATLKAPEVERLCPTEDIEDSSDPFSDRDDPLPAIEEAHPEEAVTNEKVDAIKPCVRALVDEWDSDEAAKDVVQSTIRPFKKHVSFDNNGSVPCRISKNNALKRSAMLNDAVVEDAVTEKSIEEPTEVTEDVPTQVSTEVKSVRVSVHKSDLLERSKTPEPVSVETKEPVTVEKTPPRVESRAQSVINLLKDWDDSPVKQRNEKPQLIARVLLDRLDSDEMVNLKNNDQPFLSVPEAEVQAATLETDPDVSVEQQSSTPESIAPTVGDQELSANESESIVARTIFDSVNVEESPEVRTDSPVPVVPQPMVEESSPKKSEAEQLYESTSHPVVTQDCPARQTRSHNKSDESSGAVPNIIESPTTRSRASKQTSIKDWISSATNDPPPQEPVIEPQKPVPKAKRGTRGRAKSVLFDATSEEVVETQKPAGRSLRSRTKSVFAEKPPLVEEPGPEEAMPAKQPTESTVEAPSGSYNTEVMKEAGGTACAARQGEKQESKECSTTRPTPIICNRVPIQISSEDEDDAPLAKRHKVFRKRRSMTRQRNTVRDLNANRRLFRGVGTHNDSLIADGTSLGQSTFIKTEPQDVAETSEYYPVPAVSFAVTAPKDNAERLLSVVTVQNNQVVHAENYDADSPPRKHYFAKDLVQFTDPAATSTPIRESDPPPVPEHIFATPEPVRVAKRKRRTKQELEADRQAKQQKKDEESAEQSRQQEAKARPKRDTKFIVPADPDTVDPTIQEFVCAACSERIPRDKWEPHYAKHTGLTYRVDIDPAVNLYDETTAVAIVARFMKVHRQVTIYCDKCKVPKKSALGLVSHRLVCGMTKQEIEDSKLTCEHCNRKLMAVSMNCHLYSHCPVLKKKKYEQALQEASQKSEEAGNTDVDPATLTHRGTIKRKATAKAEKRIQNISYSELILTVSKDKVTDGCLALWKTQLRKARTALCVFRTCDFTGSDEMEMRHHHEFCPSPCEVFECKNCKHQTETIELMAKHIKHKHAAVLASITAAESSGTDAKMSSESSDDEGASGVDENEEPFGASFDDDEKSKKTKRKSLKSLLKASGSKLGQTIRDQFNEESDVYREMVLDEVIQLRSLKCDFHLTSREWTAEFRRKYYSRTILFSELRPDLDVRFLTFNMVQEYIPKRSRSLRFTIRSTNLYNAPVLAKEYTEKWQHLDVFSGQVNDKESVFYCGGPVVALDWLPVPDGQDEHQILAVACKKDFDEFYLADRIYPTKCLIQVWDVGFLSNNSLYNRKVETSVPKLLYSIACDFGPIWSLKFCPSGCYNSKDNGEDYDRLGLLAAAGSDGNVHIFSLGRNYEHLISNSYRVVNLAPVLKLTLSLTGDNRSPQYECHSAVKLSWSKSKTHTVIAAGYSNGAAAVWNLTSTSPLLTGSKDGIRALLPVHKIFIPDSCITAVDLHYTDDTRYLLVCNADRKVLVYDLSTGYLPVEVCSVNARSKVTTACWNTHFPLITMAFDDVYAIDRCALTFHQTREIGLRLHPLYTFTAEATDMSSSDHLSTHAIGTDGGDVLCHQPMAYVHHMGQKNTQLMKYILTSTISVKVTEEPTDNSYAMFEKNYGVLFSDSDKHPSRMDLKSLQVKSFRRALLHEYPGIRVNQVRWNPNEKSHQYYAIGYQSGFVRVRLFRLK